MAWAVAFWVCDILTHEPTVMHVSSHHESPTLRRGVSLYSSDEVTSLPSIVSHVVDRLDLRNLIKSQWGSHGKFLNPFFNTHLLISDLTAVRYIPIQRYSNPKGLLTLHILSYICMEEGLRCCHCVREGLPSTCVWHRPQVMEAGSCRASLCLRVTGFFFSFGFLWKPKLLKLLVFLQLFVCLSNNSWLSWLMETTLTDL